MARDIINVGETTVAELVRRGVNKEAAVRAVQATNNAGTEQALDWVRKHYKPSGDTGDQGIAKRRNDHHRLGAKIAGEARSAESGANSEAGMQSNKEKSLEFLTHALAEVGFSPAHARRACLATNLAGVPQAIEWALAHLDEENNASQELLNRQGNLVNRDVGYNDNQNDQGLIVELPDGKLFRLSNPNGRVVEMPNGSVVEMVDGQVVEMSNGQQLEMVDGSLIEIRPASISLDEGETVGHRILDLETSRQVAMASRGVGSQANLPGASNVPSTPMRQQPNNDSAYDKRAQDQEDKIRRQQLQANAREEQLNLQAQQLSERDKAMASKQQQIAQHQQGLKELEANLQRDRSKLQNEQELLEKRASALKRKETELQAREAKLERMQQELMRQRDQIRNMDKELKEREAAVQTAMANGASASSTVRQVTDSGSDREEGEKEKSAMDNIEAGRIRFQELTLGTLLGSGSFADVYRAEWRMPCAVKKMKGRISKEQMAEFVREGEMMRSLKHHGIVKLLGVCVENGSFYLVQEIVNGHGNLFDYLHKKNQRLTYWQVLQIAVGICDAMAYLHERHIVHRDLKPQNCLLVNDKGEVKLCDFGLARLKNAAFVETVSNTAGTPAYQAPEMLRDEPISEKVDLYGFAVMLWEMYTGKLPWSDKNYHQMIHTVAVRNERPPIPPEMPREFVAVIEQCWHPVPQKRPSFSELKATLRDLLKSVPQDIPVPKVQSNQYSQQNQARQNPQQQYYVQHQQPRAHGVVPQYHAPSAQPVLYGGFQQNW